MSIEVMIADDHAIVRDGIKAVIQSLGNEIEVIGEASNGKEVLEMAEKNPAHVYILDISMPMLNGIETTERLVKMNPKSKVIILSMHDDKNFVEKAFKSGAKGYLLKSSSSEEIVHSIHEVFNNRFYIDTRVSSFIVRGFLGENYPSEKKDRSSDLTRREREILQLIAEGFSNKEIASQLNLSFHTANFHKKNIMRKLDIHKQTDLVRYALKEGIAQL